MSARKRKILLCCASGAAVMAAVMITVFIKKEETEPTVRENQRIVYAVVSDIVGNEMTYQEVEEEIVAAFLETGENEESKESDDKAFNETGENEESNETGNKAFGETNENRESSKTGRRTFGETRENSAEERSQRGMGDMPEDGFLEQPGMGERPDMGEEPNFSKETAATEIATEEMSSTKEKIQQDFEKDSVQKSGDDKSAEGVEQMMQSQTVTALIPVGATVHTAADKETTFSRLVSGDLLKLLLETDASGEEKIVEIWMMQ